MFKKSKSDFCILLYVTLVCSVFLWGCSDVNKENTSVPQDQMDIFTAVGNGDLEMVQSLISSGVDIDVQEPLIGSSPLTLSCVYGHHDIAEWLVKHGADLNLRNKDGNTPLHIASFHCHVSCVKLLLAQGAEVNLTNKRGETALDIVSAPWTPELKRFYYYIHDLFQVHFDMRRIESRRLPIAEMLKEAGMKLNGGS